jgi:cytochrome c peroxidase
MRAIGGASRSTWAALAAIAVAVVAACAAPDDAAPATTAVSAVPPPGPQCVVGAYPAGPYGILAGATLADLTVDVLDEKGAATKLSFHDAHAPCAPSPQVFVVRVQAGFCGTCRWQAAHFDATLGPDLRARVRVLDLLVRDDDGEHPSVADLATWRGRQGSPAAVALDPEMRFVVPRHALPRVLVVDPRTMKIRASLDDPPPEVLADAVAAAAADIDHAPAPPTTPVKRVDGRFTSQQWDMLHAMQLFAGPAPHDPTNRVGDDDFAAELGNELFEDLTLSPSGLVSCERCHEKGRTFQDNSETATGGVGGGDRNTPSVVLAAWSRWQLWDGRADTLWMQALMPIEDANEFGSTRLFVAHRVYDAYKSRYEGTFGYMPPLYEAARFPASGKPGDAPWEAMTQADRDAVTQVFVNVGKSIAAFERSFRATQLPFEVYLTGVSDALSEPQKDGIVAFFEAGCAQCHWGNRMTDDAFHVIRFPTGRHDLAPDRGRVDGFAKHDASEFRSDGRWSDAKIARTKPVDASTLGGFKTPSLRGVAVTAPYGHGGSVPLLTMAVDLHRTGGEPDGSRYTTGVADPFLVEFPADRVDSIVAFLSTLGLGFVR